MLMEVQDWEGGGGVATHEPPLLWSQNKPKTRGLQLTSRMDSHLETYISNQKIQSFMNDLKEIINLS